MYECSRIVQNNIWTLNMLTKKIKFIFIYTDDKCIKNANRSMKRKYQEKIAEKQSAAWRTQQPQPSIQQTQEAINIK